MTPPHEFARPHRLDRIGAGEARIHVEADAAERDRLARRFGLQAVDALAADYALRRDAVGIIATGRLTAAVVQSCIASGDPVPAAIDEPFRIRFLPEPDGDAIADEVELDADDCDTVFFTGTAIDLGEAAAETLALSLDPFPRSPAAAQALRDAGVIAEDEVRPASGLAGLADLLKKD